MPHMERANCVSSLGDTSIPAAVWATLICCGAVKDNSPFGPFIFTVWPLTEAVRPDGMTTGFFPMRDIVSTLRGPEP